MGIHELIKNAQTVDLCPELTDSEKRIIDQKGKIAAAILSKRYDLQMNQTDFANHMGVSQGMISRWENGDYNFTIATLQEICDKLGLRLNINMDEIIEETEDAFTEDAPTAYSAQESTPVNLLVSAISSMRNMYARSSHTSNPVHTNTFNSGGYAYATVR